MQTTVNIGVRDLKPKNALVNADTKENIIRTSDRKLWTASGELEEVSSLRQSQFAHGLKQVLHALAVHIEAMICFNGVHESWK